MKHSNKTLLLLTIIISGLLFILGAEISCRFFFKENLDVVLDERNLTYRYDKELGWFPQENSQKSFTGSRKIDVLHNSLGFRGELPSEKKKPRVIFLGDSFVWGYDVEQSERFTEQLGKLNPELEIFNLGVSGYGTDQQYLLLRKKIKYYDPDLVFLIFTHNDREDNSLNNNNDGYYKPYFQMEKGRLVLKGTPVAKSANYFFSEYGFLEKSFFVRAIVKFCFHFFATPMMVFDDPTEAIVVEMSRFIEENGGRLVVGFQSKDGQLESVLNDNGIAHIDLRNFYMYSSHGNHWTPKGHEYVSRRIHDFFVKNKFFGLYEKDK